MDRNKAPEKIYVNFPFGERHPERGPLVTRQGVNARDTEYTRTDAFIEKACKFIRKGGMHGDGYIVTEFGEEVFDFIQFAEDFRKYMKGD